MTRLTYLLVAALLLVACSGETTMDTPADPIDTGTGSDLLPDFLEDLAPDLYVAPPKDTEQPADSDTPDTIDAVDTSPPPCPSWAPANTTGALQNLDLLELSGLVASRTYPGVFWAHNDSGDVPRLFALDVSGADLGVVDIDDADALDWEDLGLGPCPDAAGDCFYIGDIGDNPRNRTHVTVYIAAEPEPGPDGRWTGSEGGTASAQAIQFTYPGGPLDAEALFVDPDSGDVYIVEKTVDGASAIYRAAAPFTEGDPRELTPVGETTLGIVTGADISADGSLILIRNYFAAAGYRRPINTPLADAFSGIPCEAPLGMELQGESIAFTGEGDDYLTISEGLQAPIHRFATE